MTQETFSEGKLIAHMAHLGDLERAGERLQLTIGPFTAMLLISALQLVLRHPDLTPTVRVHIKAMLGQLALGFKDELSREIIRRGNKKEYDL